MSRAPDHIMRDLARKAAEDAADRINLTAQLLPDAADRMMIALSVAGTAMGSASGWAERKLVDAGSEPRSVEDQVDFMWREIMRPLALAGCGGDPADFQVLLSRCRS